MVVEGMVFDIDTVEDTYAEGVGFHNHIPSNLVQVGFDILWWPSLPWHWCIPCILRILKILGVLLRELLRHPWLPRSPWCHIVERIYPVYFFHLQLFQFWAVFSCMILCTKSTHLYTLKRTFSKWMFFPNFGQKIAKI